jgi:hypothetical protein
VETILLILKEIIWPFTILMIALLFRQEVRNAMKRLEKAKLPGGGELEFGKTAIDTKSLPLDSNINAPKEFRVERVGSIYWISFDITSTVDKVLRNAPKGELVIGLTQARHHLDRIGFGDTEISRRLEKLDSQVQKFQESDLNQGVRNVLASNLNNIAIEIGKSIEKSDKEFKPGPYFE